MTSTHLLVNKKVVRPLAADSENEREHRLLEVLFASGLVSKSDEIRFYPPNKAEGTVWEERTFYYRSTYVRSRERHQVVKPKKKGSNASGKMLIKPETTELYRFRYWVKRRLSVDRQNQAMTWNNRGNELLNQGRYEEALQCYNSAISVEPYSSISWNNKGAALHDMGKHHDSLRCYEMALKMNNQNAVAWIGKGAVLHSMKKHNDAIACYDRALKINPLLSDAWYNRGIVLKKLGDNQRADLDLKRAEEIEKSIH